MSLFKSIRYYILDRIMFKNWDWFSERRSVHTERVLAKYILMDLFWPDQFKKLYGHRKIFKLFDFAFTYYNRLTSSMRRMSNTSTYSKNK